MFYGFQVRMILSYCLYLSYYVLDFINTWHFCRTCTCLYQMESTIIYIRLWFIKYPPSLSPPHKIDTDRIKQIFPMPKVNYWDQTKNWDFSLSVIQLFVVTGDVSWCRFHELSEFDETKRSCRRRLAGHNERRRKNTAESHAEGSSRKGTGTHQLKDIVCGQVDDRGRIQITIHENSTYKHFQIR